MSICSLKALIPLSVRPRPRAGPFADKIEERSLAAMCFTSWRGAAGRRCRPRVRPAAPRFSCGRPRPFDRSAPPNWGWVSIARCPRFGRLDGS